MSNLKIALEKEFKKKKISLLSEERKIELKKNALDAILKDINDKKNRFIFYCPDIALVNPLVKLVYEVALEVKEAGYNVVMLHEVNGYKAHWLFDNKIYLNGEKKQDFKSLPVEYVINKANTSKKSKKTSNMYSFNVTDTLIVTDAYQDILENILSEESLKLVQKIVLVTGYMGLAALQPGMDYNRLNVSSLIFFDDNVKDDYNELFTTKNYIIDNYAISKSFERKNIDSTSVYPVIGITSIGNNDKAQQLINVFYNKYPNLNMFTFSILGREDMNTFVDSVKSSAAVVVLDKNIVTKQMIYEILNVGTPLILPQRREFMNNQIIVENFIVSDDIFEMADAIANFCQYWVNDSTATLQENIFKIADKLFVEERTVENFSQTVNSIFTELQNNRYNTFNNLIESIPHE